MQNPGGNFEALREADTNVVTHRVALDLTNYAAGAEGASAAASSEFSADWPAVGAIDRDQTHINAGAAAGAENGVGQSVWQGSVLADGAGVLSPNEILDIDLGQERQINRLTLIFWPADTKNGNLGAIAPKDFLIETKTDTPVLYGEGDYGDGPYGGDPIFSPWVGLVDKNAEVGKPATTIVAGQVTDNTSDYNVFEDPTLQTVRFIRITMSKLQAPSVRARVVEVLATRAVDISDDVIVVNVARRKDYRLNRRLAAELNLSLRNFDRKYSPNHVPTDEELAAGFFNAELRPNLQVRAFMGFSGLEVEVFTGYLDRIEPDGKNRLATIKARDFFKYFLGKKITTGLKSSKALEFLVELLANLANFPSNLMRLDTTTISPAFFMPKDEEIMTLMQKLGDSTGDSEVFVDELGTFAFRSYLNVISHVFTLNSQADFLAGTFANTTATDEPGVVRLTQTLGNYDPEGTWISGLSPLLDGKVMFDIFQAVVENGSATAIDFFLRVTNDGGVTFTPFREIIPGQRISKWNPAYSQIQIKARLRSSNVAQTSKLFSATVKYKSRGGSSKIPAEANFTFSESGTLLGLRQVLTDEIGGTNYIVTKSFVKSKPLFLAAGSQVAWTATVNGEFVSGSNPLSVAVGTLTFQVDFGNTKYDVPQTVLLTLGTATATAMISSHPTKPVLTLTVTAPGTITNLQVEGVPFVQTGTVEAETDAPQRNLALYGERTDVLENDYIDNEDLASDISKIVISRFKQPLTWLPTASARLAPNAQVNDRATIIEESTDLDADFYIIGAQHRVEVSGASEAGTGTEFEMVRIGTEGNACLPAHWGSPFRFDSFRFGGCQDLVIPT